MTADLLIENFETLAAAPGGIPKLRELILSLAVRGSLSPNEPGHGNSSAPEAETSEGPYAIPPSWSWVRIGQTMDMINGRAFKPSDWSRTGLPIVRIQNLNRPDAPYNYCAGQADERHIIDDGEFLISWSGTPGTSFGAFIWNRGKAVLNQHIFRCVLKPGFVKEFLRLAINAELDEMISRAHGGVGLRHVTKGELESMFIVKPPLPEQHRIVAKVDELMALCDELEARQEEARKTQAALTRSALHHLTTATAPAEFASRWNFIRRNFQSLEARPENVAELRRTILQLAVDGDLIGPNTTTQPEHLKRVGDYVEFLNGYAFKSQWFQPTGVRLVRNVNVGHGNIDWTDDARISADQASQFDQYLLRSGDIVLSLDRPLISTGLKVAKVVDADLPCLLLQRVAKVELRSDDLVPSYFLTWLQSPRFTDAIDPGRSKGVPHISTRQVESMEFNLPPLPEQHRIVARVDELMKLCDELEAGLTRERADADRLFDAVVARLMEKAA